MLQNILLPLALIGIGATSMPSTPPADVGPGSDAPDFSIAQWYNFEGGDTLQSLQGKVVLLDFWRTW